MLSTQCTGGLCKASENDKEEHKKGRMPEKDRILTRIGNNDNEEDDDVDNDDGDGDEGGVTNANVCTKIFSMNRERFDLAKFMKFRWKFRI